MTRVARGLVILGILLVSGAACSRAGAMAAGPRPRSDLITLEEIQQRGQFSNLYNLVEILRPRWLRPQGPDTFTGRQGQVQVHMDGNRLGSVDVLKGIAAHGVTSLRWLGPIDAAARFGLDHGHGAIIISTAPVH